MLRKVTVVALEQAVAAPLATRLLAADGARVIKLERVSCFDIKVCSASLGPGGALKPGDV